MRYLAFDYAYGESFQRKDQNKTFLHGRRISNIEGSLDWEIFTQIESNEFARLTARLLGGGGLRYSLIPNSTEQALIVGGGAFWQQEIVSEEGGTTDSGRRENGVGNFYLVLKQKIADNLSFVNTAYYQPKFTDAKDFRASDIGTLNIALIKHLSFNLSFEIVHDNRPPQQVQKTDISYATSIQYQF